MIILFSEQNLNQYKIFYTVALTGNISHAAEKLYISQPAISKAVSKLEENMNTRLFLRNHRGVILTNEGKILFEQLKIAFDAIKIGEERIKKINELGIGQIKIGASTTLAKYMLIPYLKKFAEQFPHIKIVIECQSSSRTAKLLDENEIDIALMVKPELNYNFNFYPVKEIEYIFVAAQPYLDNLHMREDLSALTAKEKELNLFKSANLMLLDEENITRQYVDTYFNDNNIEFTHLLEVSNMDLIIEFARIGLGMACVIKEFVHDDLANGKISEIPLLTPIPKKSVGFAYSQKIPLSSSAEKFVQFYETFSQV